MKTYIVADSQADFRANLGREIMASSPGEAATRYCAIERIRPDYVWIAEEGDPTGQELPTP
jgi:hypothetical protein